MWRDSFAVAIDPLMKTNGRRVLGISAVALLAACTTDSPTATQLRFKPALGKSPGGNVSVNSATPNYGHQGDALAVHVYGSGFANGAKATWVLAGDSTQVVTISTTFVSSSELIANVQVSSTATLSLYDIVVANKDGKKGVGAELFAVTTATPLGTGTLGDDATVLGMNDLGYVVGYAGPPFVFDGSKMISLGSGQAWGIDPSGDVVVGRDSVNSKLAGAVTWTRTAPGVYGSRVFLPMPANAIGGIARKVARQANGDLLAVGSIGYQITKQQRDFKPVVWRRTASGWQLPLQLSMPGSTGSVMDVNGRGQMVGFGTLPDGSGVQLIGDDPTTYTIPTAALVTAINEAGTIVTGIASAGAAAFWYRDPSTGRWNVNPVLLAPGPTGCSKAEDVNDAGIIVGWGCVWRLDLSVSPPIPGSPSILPGLGQPGTGQRNGQPRAISNVAPYIVAGEAQTTPKRLAVKWLLP